MKIPAAKDCGLREHLVLLEGGGQKQRFEDRARRPCRVGWIYRGYQTPVVYIDDYAYGARGPQRGSQGCLRGSLGS